jgi:hypothetical protein
MMKLGSISLLLFANTCLAAGLTDGNYKGSGLWKSEKDTGSYSVTTAIKSNKVSASYELPDGTQKEWIFDMDPSNNGFFKVKTFGAEIGSGYCLEKAEVCHYEIQVGKLKLEETLTLQNDKLYRFGSKDDGAGRTVWQEAMDKE